MIVAKSEVIINEFAKNQATYERPRHDSLYTVKENWYFTGGDRTMAKRQKWGKRYKPSKVG